MHKIVLAITGASGAIYSNQLIKKLLHIKDQWNELAVVMTDNARLVWKTELENEEFSNYPVSFYETKDFQNALDQYNKAVVSDPGFAEAYYHRGRAYTELNDFSSAINEYTKAIELNPNHEKAYINRGYIYNEMKIFKSAIKDFTRGIEINPNSVFGYYNMGVAYYSLGNKEKTVESFQAAARLGDIDSQDWLRSNGYNW